VTIGRLSSTQGHTSRCSLPGRVLLLVLAAAHLPLAGRCQYLYGKENPPEILAVFDGPESLRAYMRAGGRITGQKNAFGQTAAMFAASGSAEVIQLFVAAGGKFTTDRDADGRTAAMYAVSTLRGTENERQRPAAIAAFVKAGGVFTDDQDNRGSTAAMEVAGIPGEVAAFVRAGGHFGNQQDSAGETAGMFAIFGGADAIRAFSAAGGKFTSQQNTRDESAKDIAARRGPEILAAYEEAVKNQGGLVYLSTDTEFTAFRNVLALESFIKSGGHFDFQRDNDGRTAAMIAAMKGPAIFRMFVDNGGKLTTQQDKQRNSIESLNTSRDQELHAIYLEAVKRQGGLMTLLPADQYEAARIGAPAILAFARSGGKFTDLPNQDDMTSAMIAATSGPEAVAAFYKATHRWSDWQNKRGFDVAMVAVIAGPDTIRAFGRNGGKFTSLRDEHGLTAAMWAATVRERGSPDARTALKFPQRVAAVSMRGGDRIQAFFEAGGRFTDEQNQAGETAAMLAIDNGPDATRAFAKAGGHFTGQENKNGLTAEICAVFRGADEVRAFAEAGGHFTDHLTSSGNSSEKTAALGAAQTIAAYSEAGGLFTDRDYGAGWTSEKLASDQSEWMAQSVAKLSNRPLTPEIRDTWKKIYGQRDIAAAKAYQDAVVRQGGLRHVN
jgi:ankyrin repeat protein